MTFNEFKVLFQKHFARMTKDVTMLFEVDLDKDELYNLYLNSFPAGTNEIYRQRREFDCGCCRNFIKRVGNVIAIKDNEIHTVWDFETNDPMYQPVVDALDAFVRSKAVTDVWVSKDAKIGTDKNFENTDGSVLTWDHFFVELPSNLLDRSGKSEGEIKGRYRDTRNVFKRSLDEISEESVLTVLELISQNSLYKGEEWKGSLTVFLEHKRAYDKLATALEKELFAWERFIKVGASVSLLRNHSIGTLLLDVSEGEELDTAVRKYEVIVAPANYKRPKAVFTQRMLDDAKKTIQDLGYLESLGRRYATLEDISVNNILFSNRDSAKRMDGGDLFAEMAKGVPIDPKKFSRVEEVAAGTFVDSVLPTAKEVEVLLESRHIPNMVSLIAPEDKSAPSMFKWDNAFGWAYSGNITDSAIKDRVKSAGGAVDGVLRFSIQWNDKGADRNDLDAHCMEPSMNRIYFGSPVDQLTGGSLDVDIRVPQSGVPAVENITWPNKSRMKPGQYQFVVNNFHHRGGKAGFRAEIEFDGQIFSYDCDRDVRHGEYVIVANVTLSSTGEFSIEHKLPSNVSSRDVWGVKTNQFTPVSVVMFSPNYWDRQSPLLGSDPHMLASSQQGIGHRHYFFMLKDCVNPENPNGFYNEFLKEELLQHKRVFEALGSRTAVKATNDQLSGVGFSSTKHNDIFVRVKGQTERILKVKF